MTQETPSQDPEPNPNPASTSYSNGSPIVLDTARLRLPGDARSPESEVALSETKTPSLLTIDYCSRSLSNASGIDSYAPPVQGRGRRFDSPDQNEEDPTEDEVQTKRMDKAEKLTGSPPDGGWGWVVVFGSGLAFFLGGGVSRSFTLIFEQLLEIFHDTAAATSAMAAIFGAVKMCTSPLISLMCAKFSKRTVTICGGMLTAIAMLMTSFPVSLAYLYFTYGVLAAFGFNMVLTPCFVIIGEYFRKRRARAMSLAMLGGSIGGVSLPPLLGYLFGRYKYHGTMLILSGLVLNLCVAGSLFRSLQSKPAAKERKKRPEVRKEAEGDGSEASNGCSEQSGSVTAGLQNRSGQTSCELIPNDKQLDNRRGTDRVAKQSDPEIVVPEIIVDGQDDAKQVASKPDDADPDNVSLPTLPSRGSRQVSFQIEGAIVLPNSVQTDVERSRKLRKRLIRKCDDLLKSVGIPLFRQPRFVFYSLLMMGSVLSLSISGVFLSGLVADLGLQRHHTGLLLSASAAVDIPAKFLSGLTFDLKRVRPYRSLLLAVLGFLTGGCSLSMGLTAGFLDLFVVYMLYTFFASAYHTQHATVLADIVGSSDLSAAMGLCRLSQGIGFILGPTLGGHIKDRTGVYQSAYLFSGCILLAFTICYTSVDGWLLWRRMRKQESDLDISELSEGHVARYRHDSISTIT